MKFYSNVVFVYFLIIILSSFVTKSEAQEHLNYHLEARINLTERKFVVNGSLDFNTDEMNTDSLKIILNKTPVPPSIKLSGAVNSMTNYINKDGNVAYTFRFKKKTVPGTHLQLVYMYDRGYLPTSQFYLDTNFCMAGGYGSAWYPQVVNPVTGEGTKRGTGTITVFTEHSITAVMAGATNKLSEEKTETRAEFIYSKPDIFSLYAGHYIKSDFSGPIPFVTYAISKSIDGAVLSRKSAQVLEFLTSKFGTLDIPNFTIIELPQYVAEKTNIGGASVLGGVLMPTDALRQFNFALFGHEIGHQWWGNKVRVTSDEGSALLSEGLAQYGSLQVVMKFDSLNSIRYRRTGYPGYIYDQCGLGYLKNAAIGNDQPLVSLTGINQHIIGDSKGFLALDLLAETIGRDKFNLALKTIGEKYSSGQFNWDDFKSEINKAAGINMDWFYKEWFERKGAPSWKTAWTQSDNRLIINITQNDSVYRLSMDIKILCSDGQTILKHIKLNNTTGQFEFSVDKKVTNIITDPDFKILHWEDSLTPAAMELGKAQKVLILYYEQQYKKADSLGTVYLKNNIFPDRYGLRFILYSHLARIKNNENNSDQSLYYYQQAIGCASRPAEMLASTYYKIAVLAAQKKQWLLSTEAGNSAIIADDLNNSVDHMRDRIPLLPKK